MFISYYDESGDDGFPSTSSPLFVLTAMYQHHLNWKENYERVKAFKKQLAHDFPFPFHEELHTREFILNKAPYHLWGISEEDRAHIIDLYCQLTAQLEAKIISVVIVKDRLQKKDIDILDTALTYSVQRIENDLAADPQNRFEIITDWGRVGKMRKTTRRVQKINFIPSKFGPNPRRQEIQKLIEDPLPKDSSESLFHSVGRPRGVRRLVLRRSHAEGRQISETHAKGHRRQTRLRVDGNAKARVKFESRW